MNKYHNILSNMKTNKYILLALAVLSFASCYRDESTDATLPIAEIFIDGSNLEKVYNIHKNDTLIIRPVVTQSNEALPLSYKWELDQKVVSEEKDFFYVGNMLGTYSGRLIVENEDGKAFFTFMLNVNSPYEYGITVLSKDADGLPHIAFMQEPMKEGDKREFYNENCLEKNNPGEAFSSNPSDIVQTKGTLIVACQGNDSEEDGAAIYFLNEKTFVVENIVKSKEYKTFKPTKLFTPEESYDGSAYPVLSADGKMYSLPTYNAVLQPSHNLLSTYAQTGFVIGNAINNDIILWDNEANGLVCIYNGYGPYYCGDKYLLTRDQLSEDKYYNERFKILKGVATLAPIKKTATQTSQSRREVLVLAQAEDHIQRLIISTFFWRHIEGTVADYEILVNGGNFSKVSGRNYSLINENTPCIANETYRTLLFANGNKVMKWKYTGEDWLNDAVELLSVGSNEAVITSFEISDDHLKTYVAFYEPNQKGKNGSVWVFDTNNGKVLEKYNNVCYEPVEVFYKKKNQE